MIEEVAHNDPEEPTVTKSPSRRFRVVLAEDDHDLRRALARLLECDGYDVHTVASGAQLLDYLASWILCEVTRPPADAIVTDVRMPGFNGLSIVEGLRANGWPQPIIVISAFSDEVMRDRVERLGGSALLAKPFEPTDLERTLNDLILRL
jgi:CheY-like chemotaxis protein